MALKMLRSSELREVVDVGIRKHSGLWKGHTMKLLGTFTIMAILAGCESKHQIKNTIKLHLSDGLFEIESTPLNGSVIDGNRVIFIFDEKRYKNLKEKVETVSLAGEFNHFDFSKPGWEMKKGKYGIWTLTASTNTVLYGHEFVFVANKTHWLQPLPNVDPKYLLSTDEASNILIVGGEPENPWNNKLEDLKFSNSEGNTIVYRLLRPAKYDPSQQYPLVLFLHGSGERGNDNKIQTRIRNGAYEFMETAKNYSYFMLIPQCPKQGRWTGRTVNDVLEIIELTQKKYSIDHSRIYATGLSMGGYGTWNVVDANPKLFAAAVSVCGGANPSIASNISHIPFQVFHGTNDASVPVTESRSMVQALQAVGANIQYTEYENANHFIWTRVYSDKNVIDWLFKQSKK